MYYKHKERDDMLQILQYRAITVGGDEAPRRVYAYARDVVSGIERRMWKDELLERYEPVPDDKFEMTLLSII